MTTAFSNTRFPDHLSLGAMGGPVFTTDICTTASGHEQRNVSWMHPRNRYVIATSVTTEEDFNSIITFFRLHKGRAIGFRFKDWTDYSVKNQLIGMSDPCKQKYQLIKSYALGNQSDLRMITKPVLGSVRITVGGRKYEHEVDYDTGFITFKSPLPIALEIRADFEFDVPVRFDTDELRITSQDAIEISLIEVR